MKTKPAPHSPASVPEGVSSPRTPAEKKDRFSRGSFYFLMIMLGLSLLYFILMPFLL